MPTPVAGDAQAAMPAIAICTNNTQGREHIAARE
jgi:hypothetical protein